jgi:hypothetical protein
VDALAILRRIVGLPVTYWQIDGSNPVDPYLYNNPLLFHVGNVDMISYVNPVLFPPMVPAFPYSDNARSILRRVVNPSLQFNAGDWAFFGVNDLVMFDNVIDEVHHNDRARRTGLTCCIRARAYGDMRGQYPFPSKAPAVYSAHDHNVVHVEPGKEFKLSLVTHARLNFNAMTLVMEYDYEKVEILGLESSIPGINYNISKHDIRVSFASLGQTQYFLAGDALLKLKMRAIDEVHIDDEIFTIGGNTGFADAEANDIEWFDLGIARITSKDQPVGIEDPQHDFFGLAAYPNPFNKELTVSFSLDEPARVKIDLMNSMGAIVTTLINDELTAGSHLLEYEPTGGMLTNGLYFIRMEANDNSKTRHNVTRLLFFE